MELHPYLPQTAWLQYHQAQGIHVTAYSPLGNSNPTYGPPKKNGAPALLKNEVLVRIAKNRGCSPAQVSLAWGLSRGTSVIPKSKHADRIEENFGATDCELEYADFAELEKLGNEPVRFNNPSSGWGLHLYDGLQDS
jgi:alcohol dehydrogenase (NADP+)